MIVIIAYTVFPAGARAAKRHMRRGRSGYSKITLSLPPDTHRRMNGPMDGWMKRGNGWTDSLWMRDHSHEIEIDGLCESGRHASGEPGLCLFRPFILPELCLKLVKHRFHMFVLLKSNIEEFQYSTVYRIEVEKTAHIFIYCLSSTKPILESSVHRLVNEQSKLNKDKKGANGRIL